MAQSMLAPSTARASGRTAYACKSRRVPMSLTPKHRNVAGPVFATVAFLESVSEAEVQSLQLARQRIQEVQAVIGAKLMEAAIEAPARRIQRDRALLAAYIKAAATHQMVAAGASA